MFWFALKLRITVKAGLSKLFLFWRFVQTERLWTESAFVDKLWLNLTQVCVIYLKEAGLKSLSLFCLCCFSSQGDKHRNKALPNPRPRLTMGLWTHLANGCDAFVVHTRWVLMSAGGRSLCFRRSRPCAFTASIKRVIQFSTNAKKRNWSTEIRHRSDQVCSWGFSPSFLLKVLIRSSLVWSWALVLL